MGKIPSELWIGLEVLIVCIGIWRITRFIKAYKSTNRALPVEERIEAMVSSQIKNKILAAFLKRDILIIYYLFSKSAVKGAEGEKVYTLHKKVGYGGIVFGLIFVLILEGVGISYLLHHWSTIVAWIHIILSVYMIAFFIGDYKGLKRTPIVLSGDHLHFRVGLRLNAIIPLSSIETIQNGKLHFEQDKKRKDIWNLTLFGFDDPDFEIAFKEPIIIRDGFGRDLPIRKIYLTLDEKDAFLSQFNHWKTESLPG